MKPNKPQIIKVGAAHYTVTEDNAEHMNERRGVTYKELREIRINPTLSPDLRSITLLHEVFHACADFVGIEDEKLEEEDWVKRISPIFLQVLEDNPNFWK